MTISSGVAKQRLSRELFATKVAPTGIYQIMIKPVIASEARQSPESRQTARDCQVANTYSNDAIFAGLF
jgi:hypothetical protein